MFGVLVSPMARHLTERAQALQPDLVREVIGITEVPAPTFQEQERGRYVARRLTAVGVQDVSTDEVGNVVGRWPGAQQKPVVLLAAHLDTVFPPGTDTTVRVEGDVLWAPGIGDNSAGVAVMIQCARLLAEHRLATGDVIFTATVGEEGLGNLRGMQTVMERLAHQVDYVLVIDGNLGGLVCEAVGSRRYRVQVEAGGGHSWGAFGSPSAVHSLARIVTGIAELTVPQNPKTTFNVGTIAGGTSVNVIAAYAEAVIDLRSLHAGELNRLETAVRQVVTRVADADQVSARLELLGERPVGQIPDDHPLCRAVRAVHHHLGMQTYTYASSTDGNIPLSMGIPAVTVGVTAGANGHRLDEHIQAPPLSKGLTQLLMILAAVQSLGLRER